MNETTTEIVIFADESRGVLRPSSSLAGTDSSLAGTSRMVEVLLDNGQLLLVSLDALVAQPEGGHRVDAHPSLFETLTAGGDLQAEEQVVIPLMAETLTVSKREVEMGKVRFQTTVTERVEMVDEPLLRTEINMRRVEVNQFVDAPPAVRYEGDVMIIPVLEEVLVVQKRLRLKEEVYITQVQSEYHDPQSVTLRTEVLSEERLPAESSQ